MATQPEPAQFAIVAGASISREIENTLGALDILKAAIVEFKRKRTEAEAELANSLGKDLAVAPLNVEKAIGQLNTEKAKVEALSAKIASAEELQVIIQAMIEELKTAQSEPLKIFLRHKLEQLEAEVASEEDREAALKDQIAALQALLAEVEGKPPYPATARRRKK